MPATRKRRLPMEMEAGEGPAHEKGESPDEEVREGAEPDDKPSFKTNRKRSAKGAKHTKAPMDGEGCSCGGKGKGKKCSCNDGCGSYKKMDALTPQEYLAACDLGIQRRSRQYIRARLDAAARLDKKCGASGIPENAKCTKGQGQGASAQQMQPKEPIALNALERKWYEPDMYMRKSVTGGSGRGYIRTRANIAAKNNAIVGSVLGAIGGAAAGYERGGIKGALLGGAGGAAAGGTFSYAGGYLGGALAGSAEKSLGLRSARTEYARRKKYGDSVWAKGFSS